MTPQEALDALDDRFAPADERTAAVAVLREVVGRIEQLERERDALDAVRRLTDRLSTDPDSGVQNVRLQVNLIIDQYRRPR